jgi:hypothetical protein
VLTATTIGELMYRLRWAMDAAAREETDHDMKIRRNKALTVLVALEAGMAGYDAATSPGYDPLEVLWKAARRIQGQNAIASTARARRSEPNEVEGLYERLLQRVAYQRRDGKHRLYDGATSDAAIAGVVGNLLTRIHNDSDLGAPGPEDPCLLKVHRDALARVKTQTKREDDGAIVRACFAAVGYAPQLGTREKQRSYRQTQKRRAMKKK